MNRKSFLGLAGLLPFNSLIMDAKELKNIILSDEGTERMPVLFIGHGSPMNAIEDNYFSGTWKQMGQVLPVPKAILCVSAHWETAGTFVTAMTKPQTIHDFGGFPKALYDVQYPAPGSPALASEVSRIFVKSQVGYDNSWGLDHGAWSIIRHMYPKADIPVIEFSLDYRKDPPAHYNLAKELKVFRDKGVLIIGSGNMVHNLGRIDWSHMADPEFGFDWALKANDTFRKLIIEGNHKALAEYSQLGKEVQLAVPSPDHFLPLLYALALKEENEPISFFNDKAVMGSLTMTSVRIG
jgi:4,5-DOPA dioxygenase extradiol